MENANIIKQALLRIFAVSTLHSYRTRGEASVVGGIFNRGGQ